MTATAHSLIWVRIGDLDMDEATIGSWPEHATLGGQLGPNQNGKHW